ncbi:MAG: hypothetical protein ACYC3Q_14220 [Gemmatimonadaceae bacterium]
MADPVRCAAAPSRRARRLLAAAALALPFPLPSATIRAQQYAPSDSGGVLEGVRWGVTVAAIADLSAGGPTRPDSARVALRALELSAAGTPAARLALRVTAAVQDDGRVAVDEAQGEARLSSRAVVRAGRLLVPLGDAWRDHRHENALVERPLAVRRFVAPELLASAGAALSAALGPVTLHAAVVDRFSEPPAGTRTIERPNKLFSGLGYAARAELDAGRVARVLRGVELTAGGATSRLVQPLTASAPQGSIRVNAVVARQSVITAGVRWRGLADRLELHGELLAQVNESLESVSARIPADIVNGGPFYLGPTGTYAAGYGAARFTAWRHLAVLARAESLQDPELRGAQRRVQGVGVEWGGSRAIPARLRAAWEHRGARSDAAAGHRLLVEGVLSVGAHPPQGVRE